MGGICSKSSKKYQVDPEPVKPATPEPPKPIKVVSLTEAAISPDPELAGYVNEEARARNVRAQTAELMYNTHDLRYKVLVRWSLHVRQLQGQKLRYVREELDRLKGERYPHRILKLQREKAHLQELVERARIRQEKMKMKEQVECRNVEDLFGVIESECRQKVEDYFEGDGAGDFGGGDFDDGGGGLLFADEDDIYAGMPGSLPRESRGGLRDSYGNYANDESFASYGNDENWNNYDRGDNKYSSGGKHNNYSNSRKLRDATLSREESRILRGSPQNEYNYTDRHVEFPRDDEIASPRSGETSPRSPRSPRSRGRSPTNSPGRSSPGKNSPKSPKRKRIGGSVRKSASRVWSLSPEKVEDESGKMQLVGGSNTANRAHKRRRADSPDRSLSPGRGSRKNSKRSDDADPATDAKFSGDAVLESLSEEVANRLASPRVSKDPSNMKKNHPFESQSNPFESPDKDLDNLKQKPFTNSMESQLQSPQQNYGQSPLQHHYNHSPVGSGERRTRTPGTRAKSPTGQTPRTENRVERMRAGGGSLVENSPRPAHSNYYNSESKRGYLSDRGYSERKRTGNQSINQSINQKSLSNKITEDASLLGGFDSETYAAIPSWAVAPKTIKLPKLSQQYFRVPDTAHLGSTNVMHHPAKLQKGIQPALAPDLLQMLKLTGPLRLTLDGPEWPIRELIVSGRDCVVRLRGIPDEKAEYRAAAGQIDRIENPFGGRKQDAKHSQDVVNFFASRWSAVTANQMVSKIDRDFWEKLAEQMRVRGGEAGNVGGGGYGGYNNANNAGYDNANRGARGARGFGGGVGGVERVYQENKYLEHNQSLASFCTITAEKGSTLHLDGVKRGDLNVVVKGLMTRVMACNNSILHKLHVFGTDVRAELVDTSFLGPVIVSLTAGENGSDTTNTTNITNTKNADDFLNNVIATSTNSVIDNMIPRNHALRGHTFTATRSKFLSPVGIALSFEGPTNFLATGSSLIRKNSDSYPNTPPLASLSQCIVAPTQNLGDNNLSLFQDSNSNPSPSASLLCKKCFVFLESTVLNNCTSIQDGAILGSTSGLFPHQINDAVQDFAQIHDRKSRDEEEQERQQRNRQWENYLQLTGNLFVGGVDVDRRSRKMC